MIIINKKLFSFLILLILSFGIASAALADNIESYYKFDEEAGPTGTILDALGINDGTNNGSTNTSGIINFAYDFDGVNDLMTFGNLNQSSNLTINFWSNTDLFADTEQEIVLSQFRDGGNQRAWLIRTTTTGFDFVVSNDGTFTGDLVQNTGSIPTNEWVMISFVYDGSELICYVNGTENNTFTYSAGIFDTAAIFMISEYDSHTNRPTQFYDGTLDEIGIWNRALSPSEISELYNDGDGRQYPFVLQEIDVQLVSPENNSKQSGNVSFVADLNFVEINATNASLNIWYSNGTIFKTETQSISANNSNITVNFSNINGFSSGEFYWNVIAVGINSTSVVTGQAENNFTFEWRPFEVNSITFNNNSIETEMQSFVINIATLENILSVSAFINYDNRRFLSTTSCDNLGNCLIQNNIDVTTINDGGQYQDKTFFWEIFVFDGQDSFQFNTISNNQTLERIYLEECNATFPIQALKFDAFDEQNLSKIASFNFDSTFRIWLGGGNTFRNVTFNKSSISTLDLCIQPTNRTFLIDMDSNYQDSLLLYTQRDYFLENHSINNVSENISLLLLVESDSTSFIIETKEDSQAVIDGALVVIEKYYPGEDIHRITQIIRTDENGQSIAFLESENVDYRFTIVKDGVQLLRTENRKAFSEETPFKITLIVTDTIEAPWQDFEELDNLQQSLVHNETTNIVSFTYIDTSTIFNEARLLVQLNPKNSSSIVICNVTSILSSATLTCNVSEYEGVDISAQAFITRNNVESFVNGIKFKIDDSSDVFDLEGLFLACLLLMVGYSLCSVNLNLGLITGMACVVTVNLTNLVAFPSEVIYGVVALTIIIIAMVNKR